MDGRGAAGAGRAGQPPPWWPEPPPPAVLPWSAAIDTPAGTPVRRTARPRPLRPGWRLPVPLSPGGIIALTAVAALVLAVGVPLALRAFGASEGTVTTPFLSYVPPPGWSAAPADADAAMGAPSLTGVVHGPGYACDGEQHLRGFAAAALLPTDASAGPADRGERVARWFADTAYAAPDGTPPEVAIAPPRPVRVAGPDGPVDGTVTEATVRAPGGRGGCAATGGTVLALAAPVDGGAAVLLVAGDVEGGPAQPATPDRAALDTVLAGARLGPP
ncbi:MAG: hypothetical protein JNM77_11795 [Pseudonocardia sp.]|nr:hypothetical protein [Pseudonocardia sp.]